MAWLYGQRRGGERIEYRNVSGATNIYYTIRFTYRADTEKTFEEVKEEVTRDIEAKFGQFANEIHSLGGAIHYPTWSLEVVIDDYFTEENYTYATGFVIVSSSSGGSMLLVVGKSIT